MTAFGSCHYSLYLLYSNGRTIGLGLFYLIRRNLFQFPKVFHHQNIAYSFVIWKQIVVPTQANADQLYRLSAKRSAQNTQDEPNSISTVQYNPTNLFNYYTLYSLSIPSFAMRLQLILEISATYRLVSYLICRLSAQCMISNSNTNSGFWRRCVCRYFLQNNV